MLLLFLLNLKFNKKGIKKNMGSEFFNEALIILLLLFDIREQLLIRKKKGFLVFKIAHVTKMSHNDLVLN